MPRRITPHRLAYNSKVIAPDDLTDTRLLSDADILDRLDKCAGASYFHSQTDGYRVQLQRGGITYPLHHDRVLKRVRKEIA